MTNRVVTTQDRGGSWRVTVYRACGHQVNSPMREHSEARAAAHGQRLLSGRCLRCVLEHRP